MRNIIEGLGFATTQVKDATLFGMIIEKEIDFDNVFNGYKVTAVLLLAHIASLLIPVTSDLAIGVMSVIVFCLVSLTNLSTSLK